MTMMLITLLTLLQVPGYATEFKQVYHRMEHCAADMSSLMIRLRSVIECASACSEKLKGCKEFNVKYNPAGINDKWLNCHLYTNKTFNLYDEPLCKRYQVRGYVILMNLLYALVHHSSDCYETLRSC